MTYPSVFMEHPNVSGYGYVNRVPIVFQELMTLVAQLNLNNASTVAGAMQELIELRYPYPESLAAVGYRSLPLEDFRRDFLTLLVRLWKAPRRRQHRQDIVAAMVFLAQANNTTIKDVATSFS